jgi:hypothetical protein
VVVRNSKIYWDIIDGVREGRLITQIAKHIGLKKQNLNPYVQDLKKHNVLEKISRAWRVNDDALKIFVGVRSRTQIDESDKGDNYKEDTIRGHGFMFTLLPPKLPPFEARRRIFARNDIHWLPTKSGTWVGENVELGGWTIRLTPHSIISYYPEDLSIYGEDAKEVFTDMVYHWKEEVVKKLEKIFGYSFKTKTRGEEPAYNFEVSSKQYALVNNTSAKVLASEKKKLYIRSENGTLWLITDFSHNINETEVVGKPDNRNQEDATQFIKRFYNDAEQERLTIKDLKNNSETTKTELLEMQIATQKTVQDAMQAVTKFAEQMNFYGENIKTHIGAIQGMNESNKVLSQAIKKLAKIEDKRQKLTIKGQTTLKSF